MASHTTVATENKHLSDDAAVLSQSFPLAAMFPLSGNAFAQRRAKEQRLADSMAAAESVGQQHGPAATVGCMPPDDPGPPSAPPSSQSSRKAWPVGLDYSEELALPMPKLSRMASESALKQERTVSFGESKADQARGFKDQHDSSNGKKFGGVISNNGSQQKLFAKAEEVKPEKEQKRSRLATLKNKLSLKDLGKDSRKEIVVLLNDNDRSKSKIPPVLAGSNNVRVDKASAFNPKSWDSSLLPQSAPPFNGRGGRGDGLFRGPVLNEQSSHHASTEPSTPPIDSELGKG